MVLKSIKQEQFVQAIVAGKSQREAYRATYSASKMTDKTVDECACNLLKNPKVATRYAELLDKVHEKGEQLAVATAVEVLTELTAIALGKKSFPAVDMLGNDIERPVGISARIKALELLAKHHGLLTDKVEHSGSLEVKQDKLSAILEQLKL